MDLAKYLNPFTVFRQFIRHPIESFMHDQYTGYKRKTNESITSVKELVYRIAVISLFLSAILWTSIFMYIIFYYMYMPNVTHIRPVHLQFKSCEQSMGICSYPSAHVQLTRRSNMLMPGQPYRIKLALEMPESPVNKDLEDGVKYSNGKWPYLLNEVPSKYSQIHLPKLKIAWKEHIESHAKKGPPKIRIVAYLDITITQLSGYLLRNFITLLCIFRRIFML